MVRRERTAPRGAAAGRLVAWLFAAAALSVAAFLYLYFRPAPGALEPGPSPDAARMAAMQASLTAAKGENEALRRELDRLIASRRTESATAEGSATGPVGVVPTIKLPTPAPELGQRLRDQLLASAAGDENARRQMAETITAILRSGPNAFATLREVYFGVGDAHARSVLLATMVFSGAPEARDLIVDQLHSETDPEVKRALLTHASQFAPGETTKGLRDVFLNELQSSTDTAARVTALRGLRHAGDQASADAVYRAASDPSEEVRLAAMDELAQLPGGTEALRRVLEREHSPSVKQYGECRLLVAEQTR